MAIVTEISARTCTTFEKDGSWFKCEFSQTMQITEKDIKEDPELVEIKEKLWDDVNHEVESQIDKIFD